MTDLDNADAYEKVHQTHLPRARRRTALPPGPLPELTSSLASLPTLLTSLPRSACRAACLAGLLVHPALRRAAPRLDAPSWRTTVPPGALASPVPPMTGNSPPLESR